MAYAMAWAGRIFSQHEFSCARARNIQGCLTFVASNELGKFIPVERLKAILISSLRRAINPKIWVAYKRLCRKTPLDTKLLRELTMMLALAYDDEFLQEKFDFNA